MQEAYLEALKEQIGPLNSRRDRIKQDEAKHYGLAVVVYGAVCGLLLGRTDGTSGPPLDMTVVFLHLFALAWTLRSLAYRNEYYNALSELYYIKKFIGDFVPYCWTKYQNEYEHKHRKSKKTWAKNKRFGWPWSAKSEDAMPLDSNSRVQASYNPACWWIDRMKWWWSATCPYKSKFAEMSGLGIFVAITTLVAVNKHSLPLHETWPLFTILPLLWPIAIYPLIDVIMLNELMRSHRPSRARIIELANEMDDYKENWDTTNRQIRMPSWFQMKTQDHEDGT